MTADQLLNTHLWFGLFSVVAGVGTFIWLRRLRQGRGGSDRAKFWGGITICLSGFALILLYGYIFSRQ